MKYKLIATVNLIFIFCNVMILTPILVVVAIIKLATPLSMYKFWSKIITAIASQWIKNNRWFLSKTLSTCYEYSGDVLQDPNGRYLVVSNHQSWVDIFVKQFFMTGRFAFTRFFIKQELLYVPIIGLAWWGLDYPRLKRFSKEHIEKNPHKSATDIKSMRNACIKFATIPSTVAIYLEGTRFTQKKHDKQESPYQYLLKPKTKGLAVAVESLNQPFNKVLDFTIIYPNGIPSFMDYISGKVPQIKLHLNITKVPDAFYGVDFETDPQIKEAFKLWVNQLWEKKDKTLAQLLNNQ